MHFSGVIKPGSSLKHKGPPAMLGRTDLVLKVPHDLVLKGTALKIGLVVVGSIIRREVVAVRNRMDGARKDKHVIHMLLVPLICRRRHRRRLLLLALELQFHLLARLFRRRHRRRRHQQLHLEGAVHLRPRFLRQMFRRHDTRKTEAEEAEAEEMLRIGPEVAEVIGVSSVDILCSSCFPHCSPISCF